MKTVDTTNDTNLTFTKYDTFEALANDEWKKTVVCMHDSNRLQQQSGGNLVRNECWGVLGQVRMLQKYGQMSR